VLRRLDLGTAGPPPAEELDVVSRTLSRELGWDAAREEAERASLAWFFRTASGVSHC
jgi:hypothetical protein